MGDWIYGGNDFEYAKTKNKMARINWWEIYWNDVLGYLDPYQHATWAK